MQWNRDGCGWRFLAKMAYNPNPTFLGETASSFDVLSVTSMPKIKQAHICFERTECDCHINGLIACYLVITLFSGLLCVVKIRPSVLQCAPSNLDIQYASSSYHICLN